MFCVDVDAIGPELVRNLVAGEQLARSIEKHAQDLKRLRVQTKTDALPAELARGSVGLVGSKAVAAWRFRLGHDPGQECSR